MTQGIELLSKIIQDRSVLNFRAIKRRWLLDVEINLYDFIDNYMSQYRRLPSFEVLAQNGFSLLQNYPEPNDYYFRRLTDRYIMTAGRDAGMRLMRASNAYQPGDIVDTCRSLVDAISISSGNNNISLLQDECRLVMQQSSDAIFSAREGYTTGYAAFDEITGGYEPGVHVYVGRPNTGKTYFLIDNARKTWMEGARPLFVSLEMATIQSARRILSVHAGIDPNMIKTGQVATYARQEIDVLIDEMDNRPPFYMLQGEVGKPIGDIESAVDLINPDIVYIDAAYLMRTSEGRQYGSRSDNMSAVADATKSFATRVNKPVVCTVQFNREVKTGKTKKNADNANSELGIGQIGDTDAWGRNASNIFAIHSPAKDVTAQRQRILEAIKVREGAVNLKIKTNYLFNPPNFDFISIVDDSEDTEQTNEDNRNRESLAALGWAE